MTTLRRVFSILALLSYCNALLCFQLKGAAEEIPGTEDEFYTTSYTLIDVIYDWVENNTSDNKPLDTKKTRINYLPGESMKMVAVAPVSLEVPDEPFSPIEIIAPRFVSTDVLATEHQNYLFRLKPF
ncbi:MAG: hypothetical protein INR69_07495 [Mucilaginibacter polytrichastri]|nr:hypothetical protein [Mucilaginibacter polytrichastri]